VDKKMGKYLTLTQDYAQQFKPIIEERTGTNLEEILAKDICTKPNYVDDDYHDTLMLVDNRCPDSIFVNQDIYERDYKSVSTIPIDVAHELSHLVHYRIVDKKSKNRYRKSRSFREGFAEYMAFDHLLDIYDREAFKEAVKTSNRYHWDIFSKKLRHYERGYKFFRKVLGVIGRDKVFEVARSPPISEIEVKIPFLYLLRRYPAQGVRNIPNFFTKAIRTKILKKIYGYAPLDF
jgi:hypothetical protein